MKKTTLFAIFLIVLTLFSLNVTAQAKPTQEAIKNLEPYPIMLDDLERYVIYLSQQKNEDLYEVELIPGKNILVDCNVHFLQGEFKEDIVEGWGYNYYTFETDGSISTTLMACPQPKTMKFVPAPSQKVRYNSRLPIVVYLPKEYTLKYKIWNAGKEQIASKK